MTVAAGAFVGRRVLDDRRTDARGADAVAAAGQLGVNFTTLDYRTFDRDSSRVLADATGTFKKEFAAQSAAAQEARDQQQGGQQGQGAVRRAGLE